MEFDVDFRGECLHSTRERDTAALKGRERDKFEEFGGWVESGLPLLKLEPGVRGTRNKGPIFCCEIQQKGGIKSEFLKSIGSRSRIFVNHGG